MTDATVRRLATAAMLVVGATVVLGGLFLFWLNHRLLYGNDILLWSIFSPTAIAYAVAGYAIVRRSQVRVIGWLCFFAGGALEAQARKAALPVAVECEGIGRSGQEVEAGGYFCTLEALNNIAKYAHASRASVALGQTNGSLSFTVTDDGAGFDRGVTSYGTGLQGMADRLEAVGGSLRVRVRPRRGHHRDRHGARCLGSGRRSFPRRLEPVRPERRLGDVGGGAALGGARRVLGFLVGRQQQHHHCVRRAEDLSRRIEPVDAREIHVHQHELSLIHI